MLARTLGSLSLLMILHLQDTKGLLECQVLRGWGATRGRKAPVGSKGNLEGLEKLAQKAYQAKKGRKVK